MRTFGRRCRTTLAANRVERGAGNGNNQVSLLAGLIYDAHGELMTPSHAVKKGIRYRYYVSKSLLTEGVRAEGRGQRLSAANIEALLTDRLRAWLTDSVAVLNAVLAGPTPLPTRGFWTGQRGLPPLGRTSMRSG